MKAENTRSGYNSLVPAVEQAARILVYLARASSRESTLTEICRQVGIHKSKGHAILKTLSRFGFVGRDERNKTYALGPGLVHLARKVLDDMDIGKTAGPYLERLAEETRATAVLGLLSAEQIFVVAKRESRGDIGVTIRVGHRFHMTAGAHGKAVVAFLPQEERARVLARRNLFFYGDPRSVDRDRLAAELKRCRSEGFAVDPGHLHPGIQAVSAPVLGHDGRVLGALILIGIFHRTRLAAHGRATARAARDLSLALGAPAGGPGSRDRPGGANDA
ncbi:MAG: IclR family transcriptional regulator [Deltaproteobacteria bacterium]|nr:IclR family transcriptional regulator [Deltaproteobacteria bacterium]MBW1956821.1 IclR family transcriptional regulator [Deltaproteobacteria bacterium]MBW2006693.1 IclR family transcriptional regulator [Deltaproteobacteria bacterium]MBW2102696.1 IclR family transcriptional regulator [Deltaproteobacteria bacterium]